MVHVRSKVPRIKLARTSVIGIGSPGIGQTSHRQILSLSKAAVGKRYLELGVPRHTNYHSSACSVGITVLTLTLSHLASSNEGPNAHYTQLGAVVEAVQ